MLSLKNLMDNGYMNMDGKVISLTELNEFANMSVSDFVHDSVIPECWYINLFF